MNTEKQAIAGLVQRYIDAFNEADFAACLDCYRLPISFITNRGVSLLREPEEFLSMWRATHAGLRSQGYSHSVLRQAHVRLLDESLALVSVLVARYREDGAEMEVVAGLYTARRGREGWKLITVVSQRAGSLLTFGDE